MSVTEVIASPRSNSTKKKNKFRVSWKRNKQLAYQTPPESYANIDVPIVRDNVSTAPSHSSLYFSDRNTQHIAIQYDELPLHLLYQKSTYTVPQEFHPSSLTEEQIEEEQSELYSELRINVGVNERVSLERSSEDPILPYNQFKMWLRNTQGMTIDDFKEDYDEFVMWKRWKRWRRGTK